MGKKKPTEIVMIIDRSGSMETIKGDAQGGVNGFLEEMRKQANDGYEVYVTIAQFDDVYEQLYVHEDPRHIGRYEMIPRGMTAMNDAIGKTINSVVAKQKESCFKGKTICVIVTDGMENASREWSGSKVKDLIAERKCNKWEFSFLAADESALRGGIGYGVATYDASKIGMAASNQGSIYAAAAVVRGMSSSFNTAYAASTGLENLTEEKED